MKKHVRLERQIGHIQHRLADDFDADHRLGRRAHLAQGTIIRPWFANRLGRYLRFAPVDFFQPQLSRLRTIDEGQDRAQRHRDSPH